MAPKIYANAMDKCAAKHGKMPKRLTSGFERLRCAAPTRGQSVLDEYGINIATTAHSNPVGRPRKQTEFVRISPRASIGIIIAYTSRNRRAQNHGLRSGICEPQGNCPAVFTMDTGLKRRLHGLLRSTGVTSDFIEKWNPHWTSRRHAIFFSPYLTPCGSPRTL